MPELRRLLEGDADFLAELVTPEQKQALLARHPEPPRLNRDAVWIHTDDGQEALRREREEARERFRREWGREPGW